MSLRVRATVFNLVREIHEIEVDRHAYYQWLGSRPHNEDRLREFIIENDQWIEEFNEDTRIEAEPWGLDLDRALEIA